VTGVVSHGRALSCSALGAEVGDEGEPRAGPLGPAAAAGRDSGTSSAAQAAPRAWADSDARGERGRPLLRSGAVERPRALGCSVGTLAGSEPSLRAGPGRSGAGRDAGAYGRSRAEGSASPGR